MHVKGGAGPDVGKALSCCLEHGVIERRGGVSLMGKGFNVRHTQVDEELNQPLVATLEDWYLVIQEVGRNIPLAQNPGWGKDYPDASTFMVLFASSSIIPTGNVNYSLVGLTPEQAAGLKGLEGSLDGVPGIDADIAACTPLTGDERVQCWADVDRKLMEEIVPWVPWLNQSEADVVGPTVTKYEFDQLAHGLGVEHEARASRPVDLRKPRGPA